MVKDSKYIVVFVTVPSPEEAEKLAAELER